MSGAGQAFALLGDPVEHSRSPAMHTAAFAAMGLPHTYVAWRVAAVDLAAALTEARGRFAGLNLTVPHKRAAIPLLDAVDPAAARIGAVNTIAIVDGRLHGSNTDAPGFLDALAELGGPSVVRAVVLGGGGAGQAIVHALAEASAVAWVSRDPAALPAIAGATPHAWADLDAACAAADLVVNATSVGMPGGPPSFPRPVPWSRVAAGARAIDIVTSRSPGGFLDEAERTGLRVQDGRAMLLWQGVRALRTWLGREIPTAAIAAMRRALA